jgi:hypothetical protein
MNKNFPEVQMLWKEYDYWASNVVEYRKDLQDIMNSAVSHVSAERLANTIGEMEYYAKEAYDKYASFLKQYNIEPLH